jgi:prepilin-type N-terminal cleavage/methylation domain-containing protein
MFQNARQSSGPRRGFTLVELLVVIAIIAVLAALAASAVIAVMGRQQGRNTESTIKTVNKLLQARWSSIIAEARKETPSDAVVALAGMDSERAKVIWVKVRLAEAFPIAYKEMDPNDATTIVNKYIIAPGAKIKPHFAKYRATVKVYPPIPGPTESSACLLMALKTLQTDGGVGFEDQIKYAVADTNGDGMNELVDAWGNPLAFYRFPWNNADLQAANPATPGSRNFKFSDPIDTGGALLQDRGNKTWTGRPIFEAQFHDVKDNFAGTPHMGNANFVIPVIVSNGPDGLLGLGADLSVTDTKKAADNIYSFKLKLD